MEKQASISSNIDLKYSVRPDLAGRYTEKISSDGKDEIQN